MLTMQTPWVVVDPPSYMVAMPAILMKVSLRMLLPEHTMRTDYLSAVGSFTDKDCHSLSSASSVSAVGTSVRALTSAIAPRIVIVDQPKIG